MMPKMSFSVQRRVSTMTTRLFNSAGVSSRGEGRTLHELTIGGDDDVSEFSLRVNSIPPGEEDITNLRVDCLAYSNGPLDLWHQRG